MSTAYAFLAGAVVGIILMLCIVAAMSGMGDPDDDTEVNGPEFL